MPKRWVLEIVVCIVGLYLIITGGAKLFDFKQFGYDMQAQPIAGWIQIGLKYAIPFIQIGLAVCLVFDKTRLYAFIASTGLITSYILYILAISHDFFVFQPCSCTWINRNLTFDNTLQINIMAFTWTVYGLFSNLTFRWVKSGKHRRLPKMHQIKLNIKELVS